MPKSIIYCVRCSVLLVVGVMVFGLSGLVYAQETPTPTTTPIILRNSSISGLVFNDVNQNGTRDIGIQTEPIFVGWSVKVYDSSWEEIASSETTLAGRYYISGLAANTYNVCLDLPSGWIQTKPLSTDVNAIVSQATSGSGTTCYQINVDGNRFPGYTANFGNYQTITPTPTFTPTSTITDVPLPTVTTDVNVETPTFTPTQTPLQTQQLEVTSVCSPNGKARWQVRNVNATPMSFSYQYFEGNAKTSRSSLIKIPAHGQIFLHTTSSYTNVAIFSLISFKVVNRQYAYDASNLECITPTLTPTNSPTPTFTLTPTPTQNPSGGFQIGGLLIADLNVNGLLDQDEQASQITEGVRISLYDENWELLQRQLTETGSYSFIEYDPGIYYVCSEALINWTQTFPSPASENTIAQPNSGHTCHRVIQNGVEIIDQLHFGYY